MVSVSGQRSHSDMGTRGTDGSIERRRVRLGYEIPGVGLETWASNVSIVVTGRLAAVYLRRVGTEHKARSVVGTV